MFSFKFQTMRSWEENRNPRLLTRKAVNRKTLEILVTMVKKEKILYKKQNGAT